MKIIVCVRDAGVGEDDKHRLSEFFKVIRNYFNCTNDNIFLSTFQDFLPMEVQVLKMSYTLTQNDKYVICEDLEYFKELIDESIKTMNSSKLHIIDTSKFGIKGRTTSEIKDNIYHINKNKIDKVNTDLVLSIR